MQKTLKQFLEEKRNQYTTEPYSTPICGSPLYQERDILEALKDWLTERKAHFINKHKFCHDVKTSMDELLKEVTSS